MPLLRRLAIPLCVLGGVLFAVATAADSNPVYGAALLTFAFGLACFFLCPLSPRARLPLLAHGGLALALVAAVADAILDFTGNVGPASSVTTAAIAAGAAGAALGRTTGDRMQRWRARGGGAQPPP
jgi:flagellar biosynthesis protein FliR